MKLKNLILFLLLTFLIAGTVSAASYVVKPGDTLSSIGSKIGQSWQELWNRNPQITDPNLIYPGDVISIDGISLGTTQRPSGYQTTLSQSLTATASTTEDIKVASLNTKDGHTLTDADVGTYIILTVSPGKGNEEKILCTGGTDTTNRKWQTCTRGFNYYNQAAGTATVYPHSPGETVIISDDDAYNATVYGYLSSNNIWSGTNTTTGQWVFNGSKGVCMYDSNFCIRSNGTDLQWSEDGFVNSYNFTSTTITQLTASTTKGITVTDSKILVNASTTQGLQFDSNGSLYNYFTTSSNNTFSGTNTFSNTFTVNGNVNLNATNTLATTTINRLTVNSWVNFSTTTAFTTSTPSATGVSFSITHNLGVIPQSFIVNSVCYSGTTSGVGSGGYNNGTSTGAIVATGATSGLQTGVSFRCAAASASFVAHTTSLTSTTATFYIDDYTATLSNIAALFTFYP